MKSPCECNDYGFERLLQETPVLGGGLVEFPRNFGFQD